MSLGRNEARPADVPKGMTPTDKRKIRSAAYSLLLAPALALAIAGCGSEATDPGANVSDVPTSSSPTPNEDPKVAEAIADLSERQGVKSEEITVVSNDEVTWRDGSLGCPEPGKMYTMALTDGVRVVLEAAGKQYEYHGGKTGSVTFCEDPQPPVPDKSSGSSDSPQ
ncbi:MAG: hypothetical protein ACRDPS_25340 [Nocardioides sp.]|uniref:hypothetical protein n=1 Tax=Nocardioides sp. TaxID=35761 RepID=UPI003D6BE742